MMFRADHLVLHSQHIVLPNISSLTYSIWLFTSSDLKTIVLPTSLFGISNAIAATVFDMEGMTNASADFASMLLRTAAVVGWVWINLLPFAINNQRQPEAIAEDGINKPWRPLPSGRLTPQQAKRLVLLFYVVAVVGSLLLGAMKQCLAGLLLGFWYNVLRVSDSSFITRNFINALGFLGFTSGALEVALGRSIWWTPKLAAWFLLVAAVVFSTVYAQDMYDQAGDAVRGRKTVPIVIGDAYARQLLTVTMLFWGLVCPWFWRTLLSIHGTFFLISAVIAYRYLAKRTKEDDMLTFRLWNAWMVYLYSLPLLGYMVD